MKYFFLFSFLFISLACNREPDGVAKVKYAGALRNYTESHDSSSAILLDTIDPHRRLYGLGPLKDYAGEILIIDGRPYSSKITAKGRNKVVQSFDLKAPYFVYAHVRDWQVIALPEGDITTENLEKLLPELARKNKLDPEKPFPFMLRGQFSTMEYSIDYQHKKKKKPKPQTSFQVKRPDLIVLGFYSKHHQGIFTPQGTNMVMNFINTTATQIGQIDHITFQGKKVQLLLPE